MKTMYKVKFYNKDFEKESSLDLHNSCVKENIYETANVSKAISKSKIVMRKQDDFLVAEVINLETNKVSAVIKKKYLTEEYLEVNQFEFKHNLDDFEPWD